MGEAAAWAKDMEITRCVPDQVRIGRMNYSSLRAAWVHLVMLTLLLWSVFGTTAAFAQTFLPADQAFRVDIQPSGPHAVQVAFVQAPGVYLYREQMSATWRPTGGAERALSWDLPPAESKFDPNFDKVVEVYHQSLLGGLRLPSDARGDAILTIGYQGCADAGICYPPQKRAFKLSLDAAGVVTQVQPHVADERTPTAPAANSASLDIRDALASGRLWLIVPAFFVAGLLLSLTPCVLPMVPILSSIIVGQKGGVSRGRGFALALSYSQGMALVYTALGVAAGLLGQGLAAYLQHPWVVLAFAALMVALALSMFGLYELRLPAAVQSGLGAGAQHLPGGRFVSVFAMGVVSALIVSPCVSAPLAGALLYISQTRDVVLGATALYAMAWGMSAPLLLVGLSAGSLLPRTGPWMTAVKVLFGVLMLGMALWVARPAWPYVQTQWLGMPVAASSHQSVLPFERVRTVAELEAALARAKAQGQPVMLDFYADWCTSCIEMEHDTFSDPLVQERLRGALLLQADVTLNGDNDRTMLQRFELFGPPGLIFFDPQGRELSDARVIGFQAPQAFLRSLQNAGL